MSIRQKLNELVRAIRPEQKHLPLAIDSKVSVLPSPVGDLFLYESTLGRGAPVLLIHSVNAAASAYEMKPIFDGLRGSRRVTAFDLPGFGLSERGNRKYDPFVYRQAVEAVLEHLHGQYGEPADIVALSLGCEFAAAATLARPDLVRSLTMISPTGFNLPESRSQKSDKLAIPRGLLSVLGAPLFALLSTKPSIEYYLRKSFVGPIDAGLARYDWLTARQKGARFAPLAFLSGKLFDEHIRTNVYERLPCPVQVVYDADAYTSFATLHTTAAHRGFVTTRIAPTQGLPQFERPKRTLVALDDFWADLDARDDVKEEPPRSHPRPNGMHETEQLHGR